MLVYFTKLYELWGKVTLGEHRHNGHLGTKNPIIKNLYIVLGMTCSKLSTSYFVLIFTLQVKSALTVTLLSDVYI